ncbi:ATP phosphoribosyltransferase regulatory subunit [Bacillus changyiensis]|uniref:ATP phosphoribosyltransferase regulatory subunit n=1 Tax=Bacillus changyiensis TaxID=3004103 RepID=UPI0022E2174B|nr:ATP phosphoribosyltransferase regulatory subunit [Bacillus changyiensis]MDA1476517.1 ATP phosphoribosyltransferase regulatory subunit [Bacillus changyiensis]
MFMFEKPDGMRDILPGLYQTMKDTRVSLTELIEQWGYQFMETPTLEFYDTVGVQSAILDQQLFKLLDQKGQTLVLRPDMTGPIARIAAANLDKHHPLRIGYAANVFRAQEQEGGRPAEFEQVGVELIGDGSTSADAEVIALVIFSLKKAGLSTFKISVGHVGIADALFMDILGNQKRVRVLQRFLYDKNYVGFREHVKSLSLSTIDQQRLLKLLNLKGGIEICDEAKAIIGSEAGKNAILQLETLWETLVDYGCADHVTIDLSMVRHMSYYNGILFEIYAENIGFPIGNGGRYDELLDRFNFSAPATGFGIRLDRLLEALKLNDVQTKIDAVIFSTEQREEAIKFAEKERTQGKKVVLQDLAGIKNIDQMTKSFQKVTYFIGSRKDERHG